MHADLTQHLEVNIPFPFAWCLVQVRVLVRVEIYLGRQRRKRIRQFLRYSKVHFGLGEIPFTIGGLVAVRLVIQCQARDDRGVVDGPEPGLKSKTGDPPGSIVWRCREERRSRCSDGKLNGRRKNICPLFRTGRL